MKLVDQTTFGGKDAEPPTERGDCLRACLCSVLGLDPDDVPHFAAVDEPWVAGVNEWLAPLGLLAVPFALALEDEPAVPRIRVGPSPRGQWCHAIAVAADGTEHDPHPSRAGFADQEGERYVILFMPTDLTAPHPALWCHGAPFLTNSRSAVPPSAASRCHPAAVIVSCRECLRRIHWTAEGWQHDAEPNGDGKEQQVIDLTHEAQPAWGRVEHPPRPPLR